MGKQDYREAIEKGRQEITVHSNSAPSRRVYRKTTKEKPKKNKSILLPTLFFLFILIPVTILIYVAAFYEPDDTLTASSVNNEVSLESQSPETPEVPVASDEDEATDEQEPAADPEAAQQQAAEKAAAEKAAEEKAAAEKVAAEKAAAEKAAAQREAAAKEQAQKEAAAKAQAQREREQAEAKRQQEKATAEQKKEQEEKASTSKTHTVQAGETLYRIAVNNYGASGASAGVEKIKQANGLSSNEITVGATLILP